MNGIVEPTAPSARERSNWNVLSLARFLLALIIALFHLSLLANRSFGWVFRLIFCNAFPVVLCFLLISGYSIGHSITVKPVGFYRRRFWRIYPVFLAAMILTYCSRPETPTLSFFGVILINLLFLGQVLVRDSYLLVGWSLNVEVWLYGLAPLFARLRGRALEVPIIASFVCFAAYTCGESLFHWPYFDGTLYGVNLPTLAFIWLAGFYLAVSAEKGRALALAVLLMSGHVLLITAIQLVHRFKHGEAQFFFAEDLVQYLSCAVLYGLVCTLFWGVIQHRFHLGHTAGRVCHFLGDISYPLYLVHAPIYTLLLHDCWKVWPFREVWFLLGAALVAAVLVYYGCDVYSRRRRA